MGDRCYVRLTVREVDRLTVDDVFGDGAFEEETPIAHGCIELIHSEMNYGGYSHLEHLAARGVPFTAFNGAGGDYGEGLTVSTGDGRIYCADCHDGGPVVSLDVFGEVPAERMKSARQFCWMQAKADAILCGLVEQDRPPAGSVVFVLFEDGEEIDGIGHPYEYACALRGDRLRADPEVDVALVPRQAPAPTTKTAVR